MRSIAANCRSVRELIIDEQKRTATNFAFSSRRSIISPRNAYVSKHPRQTVNGAGFLFRSNKSVVIHRPDVDVIGMDGECDLVR